MTTHDNERIREDMKGLLFDFWNGMNAVDSEVRDHIIESHTDLLVSKLDSALQEDRRRLREQVEDKRNKLVPHYFGNPREKEMIYVEDILSLLSDKEEDHE